MILRAKRNRRETKQQRCDCIVITFNSFFVVVTVRPECDRAGLVEVEWENNRVVNIFGSGVRLADLEPLSHRPVASRPWVRGMKTSSPLFYDRRNVRG